jgi:carbon storage regulator
VSREAAKIRCSRTFVIFHPPPTDHHEDTMLVLSRHRDESIMIGDDVVVTIVDIRGDKVRLGIEAPQSIPVHRQEVYDAIQRENRRATQTGSGATKDVEPPAEGK